MIDTARLWRESPLTAPIRSFRRAATRALPAVSWSRLVERFWWPFEAGNDLRALYARRTNQPYPAYIPDRNGTDLAVMLHGVRRRVIWQRVAILALRSLWLALLAALVVTLARFVTPVSSMFIVGVAAVVLALGYLYHRTHPVTLWTTARLLDRHWRLGEQVTTAIELSITPAPVRLASRQVASALATMRDLREQHRFRPKAPWAEAQMVLSIGLLVIGLGLVSGPGERLAAPRSLLAPEGLSASELADLGITDPAALQAQMDAYGSTYTEDYAGMDFTGADPNVDLSGIDSEALRQAAELSNRSAKELEELANALKDASVTSQAAQDIKAGDYASAAQQISDLAKSLESLSPEARADLAQRLQQASQNVQPMDPELARRLEQAAKALASKSDRAAAQGLEDLSKAITETGQNVMSQQDLARALEQMGEGGASMNDDGPTQGRTAAKPGEQGAEGQGALGEGEAGEFGFGIGDSTLAIGVAGMSQSDDGSGGAGAGQGEGSADERYQPSIPAGSSRLEVPTDQAPGPTAPRLGQAQPGAPDVVTAGPGTTGPGNAPQGNLPITTGLDANRVPRGLRPVVEGYFKNQTPNQK